MCTMLTGEVVLGSGVPIQDTRVLDQQKRQITRAIGINSIRYRQSDWTATSSRLHKLLQFCSLRSFGLCTDLQVLLLSSAYTPSRLPFQGANEPPILSSSPARQRPVVPVPVPSLLEIDERQIVANPRLLSPNFWQVEAASLARSRELHAQCYYYPVPEHPRRQFQPECCCLLAASSHCRRCCCRCAASAIAIAT